MKHSAPSPTSLIVPPCMTQSGDGTDLRCSPSAPVYGNRSESHNALLFVECSRLCCLGTACPRFKMFFIVIKSCWKQNSLRDKRKIISVFNLRSETKKQLIIGIQNLHVHLCLIYVSSSSNFILSSFLERKEDMFRLVFDISCFDCSCQSKHVKV